MKYEIGYTPQNLRDVLKNHGKTYEDLSSVLGCNVGAIQRWTRLDVQSPHYRSMSHILWLVTLDWLELRAMRGSERLAFDEIINKKKTKPTATYRSGNLNK